MGLEEFGKAPEGAPREILSPEGVEERVEREITFRITLTGGGKYRVYVADEKDARPTGSYDTMDEAIHSMATGMVFHGGLIVNPQETANMILRGLRRPGA